MRRIAFLGLGLAALVGTAGLAFWLGRLSVERATLTRLSPDETLIAVLSRDRDDPEAGVALRVESREDRRSTTILRADAGQPRGTERLIWSKDGAWLLLVGRHFWVRADLMLDNGDQLFFLHHRPTGRGWDNRHASTGPRLEASLIRGVEFTEPIRFRGDSGGGGGRPGPS